MPKKIITLVEDEDVVSRPLIRLIQDALDDEIEVKLFATGEEFHDYSQTNEFKDLVRASIFDLANTDLEKATPASGEFNIVKYITDNYRNIRVPIIVHSGFLEYLHDFKNLGTVFQIEKSGSSNKKVSDLLELMYRTGFLEIFSPNGVLESKHPNDLHEVFTSQFRGDELKELLKLLQDCHKDACKDRIAIVFERIALQALVNKLTASEIINGQAANPQVNINEHFYRRTNLGTVPVWTGDILTSKADGNRVYILKPKCDFANLSEEARADKNILICPVVAHGFPKAKNPTAPSQKEISNIANAARHNPNYGFNKLRIIPPSTFFPQGGAVDLSEPFTLKYQALTTDYDYSITLSNDFINEIATRFGAYLVRPGIAEINNEELAANP